ncbi:hypothetical protein [Paraburkholderia mimosarum]|uniref:hypothetical protein n=1 Tax=Paraburkholderia mimosarum TaxID=312026 RepID=UPI0004826CB7|nr:hypothetical protein [Paraburkholderia mimosarum]
MQHESENKRPVDGVVQDEPSDGPPRQDQPMSFEEKLRARLDAVTPSDVKECEALYDILERVRQCLGISKWSGLQGYFGKIPRCVKAVGGKAKK